MPSIPLLFVCDSIAWRLDRVLEGLGRLLGAVHQQSVPSLTLGYRIRDDLALIVIDGVDEAHVADLLSAARLPGLRRLHVPGPPEAVLAARDRGLASCHGAAEVRVLDDAASALRLALGLDDNPRSAVRVLARFPLRYRLGDEWLSGVTRDLAAGGLFVETQGVRPDIGTHVPFELRLPQTLEPLVGELVTMRHEVTGFGCRLALGDEQHLRLVRAVALLRPPAVPDTRREQPRIPARLAVRFERAHDLVRAWTSNVSTGGLLIETQLPVRLGDPLALVLTLPNDEEFEIEAEVAHVIDAVPQTGRRAACGLSFRKVPDAARQWLETFVHDAVTRPQATVLVADSDEARRARFSDALRAAGCMPIEAGNADDAMRLLVDGRFGIDVLVLGTWLPDLTPLSFLGLLRTDAGEHAIPVVAMAGDEGATAEELRAAGATALLPVPPGPDELLTAVMEQVQRARAFS